MPLEFWVLAVFLVLVVLSYLYIAALKRIP